MAKMSQKFHLELGLLRYALQLLEGRGGGRPNSSSNAIDFEEIKARADTIEIILRNEARGDAQRTGMYRRERTSERWGSRRTGLPVPWIDKSNYCSLVSPSCALWGTELLRFGHYCDIYRSLRPFVN